MTYKTRRDSETAGPPAVFADGAGASASQPANQVAHRQAGGSAVRAPVSMTANRPSRTAGWLIDTVRSTCS